MTEISPELIASRAAVGDALRKARTAAGRNVEELAAQLKVAPAKIAALESGDWSALPDDTFGRALLRSCCKALKLDPQPMLDLLPGAPVLTHLSTPAAEEGAGMSRVPERPLPRAATGGRKSRGMLGLAVLIVVLAAIIYFWPALREATRGLLPQGASPTAASGVAHENVPVASQPSFASAASQVSSPAAASAAVPAQPAAVASTPPAATASATTAAAAPAGGHALQLAATAPSWVQVTAGDGKVLFSQLLQPGAAQTVAIPAGSMPLAVVVGNAPATTLTLDGKPIDLTAATRANVARLTLK